MQQIFQLEIRKHSFNITFSHFLFYSRKENTLLPFAVVATMVNIIRVHGGDEQHLTSSLNDMLLQYSHELMYETSCLLFRVFCIWHYCWLSSCNFNKLSTFLQSFMDISKAIKGYHKREVKWF